MLDLETRGACILTKAPSLLAYGKIRFSHDGAHISFTDNPKTKVTHIEYQIMEAQWPSGRASDSGSRGRGSILTQVAVLYP